MHDIYHDFWIKASPAEIFHCLATAEGLNSWWTKQSQGLPKLGESYQFYFTPEYDWLAKVTAIVENEHIEWEMIKSDRDWDGTRLGFRLIPDGEAIRVEFYHTGWPENNAHFRRSNFCWAMLFNGMKRLLELGEETPFEERS